MKRVLLFLLILLPIYLGLSLYLLDKVYFLCPIEYKGDIIIRCDGWGKGFFASQRSGNRRHDGIDLYAPVGTAVLAARSGRVASAKDNRGMGKYVLLRHPEGIMTIYGHLSRIDVAKDDFVQQGQIIGAVGKTGNANHQGMLPHLHFEVRKKHIPQDPLAYLEQDI